MLAQSIWSNSATADIPQSAITRNSKVESEWAVSSMPRDIQGDPQNDPRTKYIHLERLHQVDNTFPEISDLDLNTAKPGLRSEIIRSTEQFLQKSQRERKAFRK
jgi:hypothetical protein